MAVPKTHGPSPPLRHVPDSRYSSGTIRNSSHTVENGASDSDMSASVSELDPPDGRDRGFHPINGRTGDFNGSVPMNHMPQVLAGPVHESPLATQHRILLRLEELERQDSRRSEARAQLLQRRQQRAEQIQSKRAEEDEARRQRYAQEDELFARSEEELDAEEAELRRQLKLIKRGLPLDGPLPPPRATSFTIPSSPSATHSPLPPNQPIRFDPFAKEPVYHGPPLSHPPPAHAPPPPPPNYQSPYRGEQSPSTPYQGGNPSRFNGEHARLPSAPSVPSAPTAPNVPSVPSVPSVPPVPPPSAAQQSGFAAVNRSASAFAPVNGASPHQHPVNPVPSTPVYNNPSSQHFQTHKHYSPMNPPPSLNKPPVAQRTETPPSAGTKRGPSTHPYMYSEAFAKRHVHCDREEPPGRGIWHHDASNTDRYIRCWHDNCGRMNWKTLHGFACHIVRHHDLPKGTLQGIQDALEKYGVVVGTEPPPPPPRTHQPVSAPQVESKPRANPTEEEDSMYEASYRIQGSASGPYQEEYIYSSDSESEEPSFQGHKVQGHEAQGYEGGKPGVVAVPLPTILAARQKRAYQKAMPNGNPPTEQNSIAESYPAQPASNAAQMPSNLIPPQPPNVISNIQNHQDSQPSSAPMSHPTQSHPMPLESTPTIQSSTLPSLSSTSEETLKLARAALQANDERSQEDSDYVPTQGAGVDSEPAGSSLIPSTIEPTPQSGVPIASTIESTAPIETIPSSVDEISGKDSVAEVPALPPNSTETMATESVSYPQLPSGRPATPPPDDSLNPTKAEPVSPYKARISVDGLARDAAKRMERLDEEDSDYVEAHDVGPRSSGRSPRTAKKQIPDDLDTPGPSMVPESMDIEPPPLVQSNTTPSKRGHKRPATADSTEKRTNGSPVKTRRTGGSFGTRIASPISIVDDSGPETTNAGEGRPAKAGGEDALNDSIHIARNTDPRSPNEPLPTVTASNRPGGNKPRRSAAVAASGKWSKLVSQPRAASTRGGKEMILEELSPEVREKVRNLSEVYPEKGVQTCHEALMRYKGDFDAALDGLLDKGEKGTRRSRRAL